MKKIILAMLVLIPVLAPAQQPVNASRVPDCLEYFSFTAAGSSVTFDNRQVGCSDWTVVSTATGFAALSLAFEEAPEAAGGIPGAWVNYTGTLISGANPLTSVTWDDYRGDGYRPFVRVTLGGLAGAGTVRGMIYGWKENPPSSVSISGASAVTVQNQLYDGDAAAWYNWFGCTESAAITITAGTTQVVALAAGEQIRICHVSLSWDATVDFNLIEGTGVNCATGPANLTGVYQDVTAVALDFEASQSALFGTAANAVCVVQTGAANGGGVIVFGRF